MRLRRYVQTGAQTFVRRPVERPLASPTAPSAAVLSNPESLKETKAAIAYPNYGTSYSSRFGASWIDRLPGARYDYMAAAGNLWQNSCILPILKWQTKAFVKAPPSVRRLKEDGTEEIIPDHPAIALLQRPNPWQSGKQLFAITLTSWNIDGNAYWLKVRNGAGQLERLRWLPWWDCRPWREPGSKNFIDYYVLRVQQKFYHIAPEDIVHFADGVNPEDDTRGIGAWSATLREVAGDNEAGTAQAALIRNFGVAGVIMSPSEALFRGGQVEEMPAAQAQAIKEAWEERTTGDNRGSALVLRFPMNVDTVGHTPADMDYRNQRFTFEERMCAAVNISPMVVGLGSGLERSTYSNMEQAQAASYEDGILPLHEQFADTLNLQLMPEFGQTTRDVTPRTGQGDEEDHSFFFDASKIPALQENTTAKYERNDQAVRSGWITPNEARADVGLPPIEGGETLRTPPTGGAGLFGAPPAADRVAGNGKSHGDATGLPIPDAEPALLGAAVKEAEGGHFVTIGGHAVFIPDHPDSAGQHAGGRPGMHAATATERSKLKIPPAWTDVHIADDPHASLQATGKDNKGRTQYRYSAEHTAKQSVAKFARSKDFHSELTSIQKSIERDRKGTGPKAEAASALHLISLTGFRVGSDRDTQAKVKAYGATTLKPEHVKVEGDTVHFDFTGKKGVRIQKTVHDAELARDIESRLARGGDRLYQTSDTKVGSYLHSVDGEFKVKDFRTWHGTSKALEAIASMAAPKSTTELEEARKRVGKVVSEHLGNTPTVALASYIDPRVFQGWEEAIKH